MNRFGFSLIVVLTAAAHAPSNAAERSLPGRAMTAEKLQPYIHCDGFAGGVRGVTLDRRPQTAEPWRALDFGDSGQRVSVIDGYRVTYSYARTYAFASLKAEQSDPSRYVEDKRIVTSEIFQLAEADGGLDLVAFSYRGYSGHTLTKRVLAGRTLGKSQIFSDDDSVIVTIYFMNQEPENRGFQTLNEFIALRNAFIHGYMECVARKKSAAAGFVR